METRQSFSINPHILYPFVVLLIFSDVGDPVSAITESLFETISENPINNEENLLNISSCKGETFSLEDVIFLDDSDIFLKTKNITVHAADYRKEDGNVFACLDSHNKNKHELITECEQKFDFDSDEFQIFPNHSVSSYGNIYLPGEYELVEGKLFVCAQDYEYEYDGFVNESNPNEIPLSKISIYVAKIGSGISIVALTIHLFIFRYLPALQNLPGYNLASLSVAFIFAYLFVIIGQIPEDLGLACVMSGVLQMTFFLAAFFCMNVMAFDVWRTLKLSAERLVLGSSNVRKRQFLWYSLYAWGFPLIISFVTVLLDNIDGVPEKFKPHFGEGDICWMTNDLALTVFFVIPSCILFTVNVLLFIWSFVIISSSTMKCTNDHHKQAAKFNCILYVRMGVMMGLTWLIGVSAFFSDNEILWFIHDLLNSLQGLFLLLLFTCTKKTVKYLKAKSSFTISRSSSGKQSTRSVSLDSRC